MHHHLAQRLIETTFILVIIMKLCNQIKIGLALLAFSLQAKGDEWIERCKIDAEKIPQCGVLYVSSNTARARVEPIENSKVVREFNFGEAVAIHWEASRYGPHDWIGYGSSGYTGTLGWIRKDSLTSLKDFEKVKSCWPIKTITDDHIDQGDYLFSVSLSKNGTGYSMISRKKVEV